MGTLFNEKGFLDNETINSWVGLAEKTYKLYAQKKALNTLKLKLTLEEVFLKFRETYGAEKECTFVCKSRIGEVSYEIKTHGAPPVDCLCIKDDLQLSYDILARIGEKPKYIYKASGGGTNSVTYSYKKAPMKNKILVSIVYAVALAFICSVLLGRMGQMGKDISAILIDVVFPKVVAVLTAVSTPLVFLAVIGGITGLGDMSSFGKIGTSLLKNMMITYLFSMAFLCIATLFIYPITTVSQGAGESIASSLTKLVLDIIPDNMIEPFLMDNALQVIVFSIFVGVSLLVLGEKARNINSFLSEITDLVYKMMSFVIKLIPAIVFLGILKLIKITNIETIISMAKMFVLFFISAVVVIIYSLIRMKRLVKTPLKEVLSYMMPTLIINITTSSQISALPENMICCKEKFKINEKMVDFGLPFGMVTFMPVGAIFLGIAVLGIAAIYGIPITPFMVIKVFALGIIVAIAAPPIPGSAFVVLPIMLSGCGVPSEHLPFAIVFGTIIGYVLPAINGVLLQLELLITSKQLGHSELA